MSYKENLINKGSDVNFMLYQEFYKFYKNTKIDKNNEKLHSSHGLYHYYNLFPFQCVDEQYYFSHNNNIGDIDKDFFNEKFFCSKTHLLKHIEKQNDMGFLENKEKLKNLYYIIGKNSIFFNTHNTNNYASKTDETLIETEFKKIPKKIPFNISKK